MGAVSLGGVVASELALNEPQFCFKKSPDRGTIAPRSGHDRASIVSSILDQRPSYEVEEECHRFPMKELQFGAECATIARRSWYFVRRDPSYDGDQVEWTITRLWPDRGAIVVPLR